MKHCWRAICDRCGFEYYAHELRKEWQGLMTCHSCWEPRHPQEFVRAKEDKQSVPWSRPEAEDSFVGVCYIEGISGYADLAVASCMIAENDTHSVTFLIELSDGPP